MVKLPIRVIRGDMRSATLSAMLMNISTQLADIVDAVAPSVVQVRARGRAASGVVYGPDLVLTTGRAIGRDEHQKYAPQMAVCLPPRSPAVVAGPPFATDTTTHLIRRRFRKHVRWRAGLAFAARPRRCSSGGCIHHAT